MIANIQGMSNEINKYRAELAAKENDLSQFKAQLNNRTD